MNIILLFERKRHEDCYKFKDSLGYRVRLCLKKIIINNTSKQKEKHLGRRRRLVETAAETEESKEEGR